MRTINLNKEEMTCDLAIEDNDLTVITLMDVDKQPCWYVKINKTEDDCYWKVGVKSRTHNEEHEFKLSDLSKSQAKDISESISTSDFPIKLLDKFRNGGKKGVKDWFKNGCR